MKVKHWIYATMAATVVLMIATVFLPIELVERGSLLVLQAVVFGYLIILGKVSR